MQVLSVEAMRAAEAAAVALGTSEDQLQRCAGAAVAAHAQRHRPSGPIVVLVGIGNNGRDGWVTALNLARKGSTVRLYLSPRHSLSPAELDAVVAVGAVVCLHDDEATLAVLRRWLADCALVVDGLLGIGARGAPRSPLDQVIAELNDARARQPRLRVLAIDVPSGIDADTGAVPGVAVQADATVVLGGLKHGLLRFPAAGFAGVLLEGEIGLPEGALPPTTAYTLTRAEIRALVPRRPSAGHKFSFGRVVVAGGSPSYFGAPYLAGVAAARSGAGLVAFAAAPALQAVLAGLLPEATYVLLPDGAPDREAVPAAERVVEAFEGAQALLVGPGLGRSDGARAFLRRVLAGRARGRSQLPLVIDADALTLLAGNRALWDDLTTGAVLTPHHGEMGRLTGLSTEEIGAEPWRIAREAAERWGQTVVLKGPFTAIAAPGEAVAVLPHANPALATAGTGDVLAGTIAGLLAQGLAPSAAARLGVYVHAAAAHRVCSTGQRDLLLASDLVPAVSQELAALRRERGDQSAAGCIAWADRL